MKERKVALITAVWKRHELTSLVLNRFRNIKDELAGTISLELIAVGSEGATSQKLCESHGFTYIEQDNMPLNRCLLYTSPSPRDATLSRMPASA